MNHSDHPSRNKQEEDAFAKLRRDRQPPQELEQTVIRGLRHHGWLRSELSEWSSRQLKVAAGFLVMFGLGYLAASRGDDEPVSMEMLSADRYFLFLYGAAETDPDQVPARVDEYRQWMVTHREAGERIDGARLTDRHRNLGDPPTEEDERMVGFFQVEARSFEEALSIAGSCPHLGHGGRVEVREAAQP